MCYIGCGKSVPSPDMFSEIAQNLHHMVQKLHQDACIPLPRLLASTQPVRTPGQRRPALSPGGRSDLGAVLQRLADVRCPTARRHLGSVEIFGNGSEHFTNLR